MSTRPPGNPLAANASPGFAHALAGALALVTAATLAFPDWFERPALWAWCSGSALLLMGLGWACTAAVGHTVSEDNSR